MNMKKRTKSDFIKYAENAHNYKYDYSKVDYIDNKTKVCIMCPEHGEFWQTPHLHLSGSGCPKCKGLYRTTQDFINDSQKIHGNKYDYSKVNYRGYNVKVCIRCPEHGEFWQIPSSHLKGRGCPICNESKLEKEVRKFLLKERIIFEQQKRFTWLKYQSLDFYLPEYNVAIECQGEQHFKPVDFAGKGEEWAMKLFHDNIIRDNKKITLCNEHNIKILYYGDVDATCIKDLKELKNKLYENRT